MRAQAHARARYLFPLLFGLLTPLSAQSPGSLSPEAPTHLRGTVINWVTHAPIPHALVYSPDHRFATMTNDEGRFDFTLPQAQSEAPSVPVAPGPQPQPPDHPMIANRPSGLLARKPGFIDDAEGQVLLQPQQDEVTVPLVPEARVLGHVVLPIPEAPSRVRVSLLRRSNWDRQVRWEPSNGAPITRADGSFRFTNLVPGTYKLLTDEFMDLDPLTFDPRGQLFGYPPIYYPGVADFESAAEIHLLAGQTFEATLTPPRREYYRVHIPVGNAAGNLQIENEIWPQNHPGPGYTLGYDPRDHALLGSLPNGAYTVVVRCFEPTMTGIANIVVSGAPVNGPSISLVPNASIPITVREELQHPSEATMTTRTPAGEEFQVNRKRPWYLNPELVPVDAFGTAQNVHLSHPTGPDDTSMHFDNVSPGRYWVRVRSGTGYASAVLSGNTDLLHEVLVVGPGSPSAIEITVRDDGAQVQGRVEGLSESRPRAVDSPYPRRQFFGFGFQQPARYWGERQPVVYFLPEPRGSSGQFLQAFVTADGQFQYRQVPPGSYRVLAFDHPEGDLEFAGEEQLSRYDSCAQRIAFTAGDQQSLRLSLCPSED